MKTIVCGRWNRHSSGHPEAKNFWATRNKFVKGEASMHELIAAETNLSKILFQELYVAGIDIVGNGSFRWDSIYDVARAVDGCRGFKQLSRIPETNHFHRQPIATSEIMSGYPILWHEFRTATRNTDLPIIMCLPGPYSLARQTQNVSEFGIEGLAMLYAKALNQEIKYLIESGAGAAMVRIEDPQILAHPEDWPLFQALANELVLGLNQSRIALATWFGDIDCLPGYFSLPFGTFFVDLVEGKWNPEELKNFPKEKSFVAGVFDARHPRQESKEELKTIVDYVSRYVPCENIMISFHTDPHFLPWDYAMAKVRSMVNFADWYELESNKKTIWRNPGDKIAIPLRPPVTPATWMPNKDALKLKISKPKPFPIAFPTSAVGSYPQFAVRPIRTKFKKGVITENEYRRTVENYAKKWMTFQDEIDMTCPVGGEFLREDMAAYFAEMLGARLCDFVPSYENRRYRPAEYFKTITVPERSMTADDFRFIQSLTKRPVKETITGPVTMADWGLINWEKYYDDRRAFRIDFAKAIRSEIEHMIKAGVKILQIDEPALTTKMKQFAWDAEALYETIRGYEDKLYTILHICYSDLGALDEAFPTILQLPFDQIHMEVANRGTGMFKLIEKHGFGGKDIGLGVIDVHTDRIETIEEVEKNVKRALNMFKPDQIWLLPDCGLKERSEEISERKLRVMCEAAKRCRETLV